MRKLYTWMAMVAVSLAAALSVHAQQMQPYTSTDGRFSINFPQGDIKTDTDTINFKDGTKGSINEIYIETDSGNVSYMVMYNDYRADQATADPQVVLAQTRDGAVGSKTLLSDMAISLNGVPGREFTAKDDTWNYTVRQFLSGKRLYQMIVVSKPDHPAAQISDFLNSFKIF